MSEHIEVSHSERIQLLRINRPEKKNALTIDMYASLAKHLREADQNDELLVTVLTGSADSYCSGNDIQDFLQNPIKDESNPVVEFVRTIIRAEKPVLAAVNGIAVGVGATMLLHCDLVYMAEAASLQFPFVNIGLCPEAGSSAVLSEVLGHQKASELLLLGGRVEAQAALQMGLVNAVFSAGELEQQVMSVARKIVLQPPNAIRITKKLIKAAMLDRITAATARENEYFMPMLKGAEAREAFSAFMEKRKADFSRC